MAIVINGSGTVTGISVGGLPDGIVDRDTLATSIDDSGDATAITIDSSENVGIGVTPEAWHSNYKALQIGLGFGVMSHTTLTDTSYFNNAYYDGSFKYATTRQASQIEQDYLGKINFKVAPSGSADAAITWTTAMTINNDTDIMIGDFSTSGATGGVRLRYDDYADGSGSIYTSAVNTATRGQFWFYNPNGQVGSIATNGSATAYNTSSDYRLKENVVPMTGSIDRLKELKPSKFNFIADADKTVDGFLAHEVSDYVPEAISGEKDAMKAEEYEVEPAVLDDDGEVVTEAVTGEREVIDPQGIDQSKLVPLLTGALQEAVAKIEELTTRIETLENA